MRLRRSTTDQEVAGDAVDILFGGADETRWLEVADASGAVFRHIDERVRVELHAGSAVLRDVREPGDRGR